MCRDAPHTISEFVGDFEALDLLAVKEGLSLVVNHLYPWTHVPFPQALLAEWRARRRGAVA